MTPSASEGHARCNGPVGRYLTRSPPREARPIKPPRCESCHAVNDDHLRHVIPATAWPSLCTRYERAPALQMARGTGWSKCMQRL